MSDSESDIEIRSALPKMVTNKPPRSPSEDIKTKKITTKMMIVDALVELKTRKGVSLYAIKKHLTDKFEVNTDKVNYLIKKTIKAGVEDGTFVQMKGIGAAGSFKLGNKKEKPKPKKKPPKLKEKNKEKSKSPEKKSKKLEKKTKQDDKKTKEARKPKMMEIKKTDKKDEKKEIKIKKLKKAPEKGDKRVNEEAKKKKVKIAKGIQTPAKKLSAMAKRKSIGSIIKPPKMKPKKA